MPRETVYQATIERLQIIDEKGNVDKALLPDLPDETLQGLFRQMLKMRAYDEKALNLQRQGRMGTYGSMRGQEAAQTGLAAALDAQDWIAPSFRDQGILEASGVPMHLWYAFCKGDERSSLFPEGIRALPPAIPVASQLVHAAGLGMGLRMRNESAIAIGLAGDGATSEGDFHEALNCASVFKARTLFYIQNNGWAISVPYHQQTAAETIAQKAIAYGMRSLQVDGNDVLAVYQAVKEAKQSIDQGNGPFLIEAVTYRLGSHTTADDASRYRDPKEVEKWQQRDPLTRMRIFLEARKLWNNEMHEAALAEISEQVEAEVAKLEAMPKPAGTDMFDYMYETLPPLLAEQREAFTREAN